MEQPILKMMPGELLEICIGTAFLVMGTTSCAIAAIRRRSGVRVFFWTGMWSAAYGAMHVLGQGAAVAALPHWAQRAAPYVFTTAMYMMVVVASLAWIDLAVGALRRCVKWAMVACSVTAALGIGWFIATGDNRRFMLENNLLAACVLLMLLVTVSFKPLFKKYLRLPNRGFLVFGTGFFALEALIQNISRPVFNRGLPVIFDHLGFFALLAAFAHSGLKLVQMNEHRLLEIEAELDVARQIQTSILPTSVPEVSGLRVSATYRPMASVAGDFYEFLPVDEKRAGFLVADVCGHGVPAALIASMLKVAVQSVGEWADDPGKFLRGLNRAMDQPLKGQLVSAAYLWVDTNERKALYSAAGHPPLLHWNHSLSRVESNGLLFGIMPEVEYPVREMSLSQGDRLLLYTDGVTEPENGTGQQFGDAQLAKVLAENRDKRPEELAGQILEEIEKWQGKADAQDDITLIVIDVA